MASPFLAEPPESKTPARGGLLFLIVVALVVLISARVLSTNWIGYLWWSELGQVDTWLNLFLYGLLPVVVVALCLWALFFAAFQIALRESEFPLFGFMRRKWVTVIGLVLTGGLAMIASAATVASWTAVRFFAGLQLPSAAREYVDPIFGRPLHFYFFELPFWNMLVHVLLAATILTCAVYWLASNLENLADRFPAARPHGFVFEADNVSLRRSLGSRLFQVGLGIVLLEMALHFFFGRYDYLFDSHGQFLTGVDWTADHILLPLQWVLIAASLAAGVLLLMRRGKMALVLLIVPLARVIIPGLVGVLYVHPNELALERPYIAHYIEATRSAYGLDRRMKETTFEAQPQVPIDYAKEKPLLDNVRLWDWRAFHDTISQIQPLRPYIYYDSDVDRYTINNELRQVLVSARELDVRQLGTAANWINQHLMYTHGYGVVMAEANRITPDGLPELLIKDAPPVVSGGGLKLTRPELYYGELSHEPVFVDTAQQEFNYPSGSETEYTEYKGKGGFPASSLLTRFAGAIHFGDFNMLLTSYLKGGSKMMLHRRVLERVGKLAPFVDWDDDPYVVVTEAGRLIWMVDGYMTSGSHPYSDEADGVNYIRNSVKATVDAYTGEVNLYVFDSSDILVEAYQRLFPKLFNPFSQMPADLRAHARYPERLFSIQANMYRAFHMRDPEAFYNRADLWDLAKTNSRQAETGVQAASPTYVVATLPGESHPEFLLLTQFTPANKDNLIGYMAARCDGTNLGELVFQQLGKQNIIYGPMQIDARINQDQSISKDLTLWNQQGSSVLRGQTLVLPIENSFLYVEPIYIQASQTSMPQLKKVALAMGNSLAYADTYEQALNQLISKVGGSEAAAPQQTAVGGQTAAAGQVSTAPTTPSPDAKRLNDVREHLRRYREFSAQGKWAEAGKELDAIQGLLQ